MTLFPPSQVRTLDTNQTERHVVKYEKSAGEESLRATGAAGRTFDLRAERPEVPAWPDQRPGHVTKCHILREFRRRVIRKPNSRGPNYETPRRLDDGWRR